MLPLWAVLAIAGAAKSELVDRPQQRKKAQLEAYKTMLSGYTKSGEQGNPVMPTANILEGAMTGGSLGLALGDTAESKFQGLFDKAPEGEWKNAEVVLPKKIVAPEQPKSKFSDMYVSGNEEAIKKALALQEEKDRAKKLEDYFKQTTFNQPFSTY